MSRDLVIEQLSKIEQEAEKLLGYKEIRAANPDQLFKLADDLETITNNAEIDNELKRRIIEFSHFIMRAQTSAKVTFETIRDSAKKFKEEF